MNGQSNLEKETVISVRGLSTQYSSRTVLKDIHLDVYKDEVFGIVGESGCGKTTLLRTMLMLLHPKKGQIKIFNKDVLRMNEYQSRDIKKRWGVMFQQSALFSSLTVIENVLFPLRTYTDLDLNLQKKIAFLKIALVGLPLDSANKYPSELSGGMQKRAALARAIALDPELLFLDEPTAGLDPHSAHHLDQLILDLRKALNLTIILVTHDLDTLSMVTDRVAFLGKGKLLAASPMRTLIKDSHPAIKEYFSGLRVERVKESIDNHEE